MPRCCVPKCDNKEGSGLSFYRIPKDNKVRSKWLKSIRQVDRTRCSFRNGYHVPARSISGVRGWQTRYGTSWLSGSLQATGSSILSDLWPSSLAVPILSKESLSRSRTYSTRRSRGLTYNTQFIVQADKVELQPADFNDSSECEWQINIPDV